MREKGLPFRLHYALAPTAIVIVEIARPTCLWIVPVQPIDLLGVLLCRSYLTHCPSLFWNFTPGGDSVDRPAISLSYRDHHYEDFCLSDLVHQSVAYASQLDLVPILAAR